MTEPIEVLNALSKQIDFYFSPENIANDHYLRSQMDAAQSVALNVIAQFPKIKMLTLDRNVIVQSIAMCKNVSMDETGQRVRHVQTKLEPLPRTTLILRDIPPSASLADVTAIFNRDGAPKGTVVNVRLDVDNTWFVTFIDEDACLEAALFVSDQMFDGQPLRCRVKTESRFKATFSSRDKPSSLSPSASPRNSSGFSPSSLREAQEMKNPPPQQEQQNQQQHQQLMQQYQRVFQQQLMQSQHLQQQMAFQQAQMMGQVGHMASPGFSPIMQPVMIPQSPGSPMMNLMMTSSPMNQMVFVPMVPTSGHMSPLASPTASPMVPPMAHPQPMPHAPVSPGSKRSGKKKKRQSDAPKSFEPSHLLSTPVTPPVSGFGFGVKPSSNVPSPQHSPGSRPTRPNRSAGSRGSKSPQSAPRSPKQQAPQSIPTSLPEPDLGLANFPALSVRRSVTPTGSPQKPPNSYASALSKVPAATSSSMTTSTSASCTTTTDTPSTAATSTATAESQTALPATGAFSKPAEPSSAS
mmetsp:Transcript_34405/g.67755  ORF Transcript_34405/g.67755 Transcript_34405/m.67755 type:complete len:522 (-) Transcript_34405:17-1582(-)|eukprot:CAMPEP_0175118688 /NCGR_PEP_ID=MMETSP0086_2-20121207/19706_1 /TAXON_ID=136419 /ORGANISM="Unknown Unknown, Strain D1" /LENGTH=521 /DNA_ID=CAMNT_0016399787 /DNA_START=178 /DNA_END=1743 /DNA_ORIENTATION=+